MACARVRTHTADGTECFPKGSDNPSSRWRRGENPGWVMQRDRIKRHPDQRPRQEGWGRCNPCVAMMAEKPGTWQSAYLTKNDGRAHKRQASIHPCIQNWRQFLQDNKAHGEMLYLMLYTCVFVPFISVSSDRNTPLYWPTCAVSRSAKMWFEGFVAYSWNVTWLSTFLSCWLSHTACSILRRSICNLLVFWWLWELSGSQQAQEHSLIRRQYCGISAQLKLEPGRNFKIYYFYTFGFS